MLCAGFEESHVMMWSLTPQPLPCQLDSNGVSNTADTGDTMAADSNATQPRF